MNKIQELFASMTDRELKAAVTEIQNRKHTGLIGDIVREWAKRTKEITGMYSVLDLHMTQINILQEAAYRWNEMIHPYEIITDQEIENVWGNADFGNVDKRYVIQDTLWKIAQGFSVGKTALSIVLELKLIEPRRDYYGLSEKGLLYITSKKELL